MANFVSWIGNFPNRGIMEGMNTRRLILLLMMGWILPASAQLKMEVEIIPLGLLDFEAAEKIAKGIVSEEGKLVADKKGHRLIVLDYPSKREALRKALMGAPRPGSNIRIKVSFVEDATTRLDTVEVPKLKLDEMKMSTDSFLEQELIVISGGKGQFRVGTNIPFGDWIYDFGLKKGYWKGMVRWKHVGAQMVVEPYDLGNKQVRLKLTPQLSYLMDSETMTTQVSELSTEIIVSDGEEVELGGITTQHKEFYARFLSGFNRAGDVRVAQIKLKTTVDSFSTGAGPTK